MEVGVTATVDDLNIAEANHIDMTGRDEILILTPFNSFTKVA